MNDVIKVRPNKDGKYIVKLFGMTIELVQELPTKEIVEEKPTTKK